jgi:hypothetical protein
MRLPRGVNEMKKKLLWFTLIGQLVFFWNAEGNDDRISEAEFLAANVGGEEISSWVQEFNPRPNSLSIFSVRTKPPLAEDFAGVIETEIYKNLTRLTDFRVQSCPDCKTPMIKVAGDRLVITKGTPDIETLKQRGRDAQVEAFLVIETFRTTMAVVMVANLYQTSSGEIIGSKTFRIPALSIGPSASMVLVNAGLGLLVGAKSSKSGGAPPLSLSVALLEELGFGKGGLTLGGVVSSDNGALAYLMPTLGWRGRFGSSGLYSLSTVGLGYGQAREAGVASRVTYDLMIGSFTNIGLEAVGLVPIQKQKSSKGFSAFAGLHIGFILGR